MTDQVIKNPQKEEENISSLRRYYLEKAYGLQTLNADDKELLIKILKSTTDDDLKNAYYFISERIKTGIVFDYVPDCNNSQVVSILVERKDLSIINDNPSSFDEENGLTNDHLLIIGENYDALKNLLLVYKNKIGVIYIDPPYNTDAAVSEKNNLSEDEITAKSSTKFVYRDKFSRTGWLNMMKDRLFMAKELLTNEGVIFVSIDDHEQAYLKVLMDEIFGKQNFISNFIWQKSKSPSGNTTSKKSINKQFEYVLIYAKDKSSIIFNSRFSLTDKELKKTYETYCEKDEYYDERGYYKLTPFWRFKFGTKFRYAKKFDYPIKAPDGTEFGIWQNEGKNDNEKCRYVWNRSSYLKGKKLGFIVVKKNPKKDHYQAYRKIYTKVRFDHKKKEVVHKNIKYNNFYEEHQTSHGTHELKKFRLQFSFPKPYQLLEYLLSIFLNKKNYIVLDFFAGCGTTSHAVMSLNQRDGGNRKFILCTNDEKIPNYDKKIATDICYERIHRLIKGKEGFERNKDNGFDWIKKHDPYKTNSLRVFEIDYVDVSINDNLGLTLDKVSENMQLIDRNFSANEKVLDKLSALRPLEKK